MYKISKKAASEYISWVIVLGMVIALSYLLYTWSIQQAQKTGEELEKRTDPLTCAEVGITVNGACQTFRTLELNITNTNNLEVKGFLLRTVGLYPEDFDYVDSETVYHEILPGDTEKISILNMATLSQIQLIPIVKKNNKEIQCEEQAVKKEKKDLKQC